MVQKPQNEHAGSARVSGRAGMPFLGPRAFSLCAITQLSHFWDAEACPKNPAGNCQQCGVTRLPIWSFFLGLLSRLLHACGMPTRKQKLTKRTTNPGKQLAAQSRSFAACPPKAPSRSRGFFQALIGQKTGSAFTSPRRIGSTGRPTNRRFPKRNRTSWPCSADTLNAESGVSNISDGRHQRKSSLGKRQVESAGKGRGSSAFRTGIFCSGSDIVRQSLFNGGFANGGRSIPITPRRMPSPSRKAIRRAEHGISPCTPPSASNRHPSPSGDGGVTSTGRNFSPPRISKKRGSWTNVPAFGGRDSTAVRRDAKPGTSKVFHGFFPAHTSAQLNRGYSLRSSTRSGNDLRPRRRSRFPA